MLIANRVLNFSGKSGDVKIPIRVFAPERKGPAEWSCRFEIDWPDGKRKATAAGFDSVQALVLALQMIGAEIYSTGYHKSGKLFLESPGHGYGFPVTAGLRDLLVGDDVKYF
jgi:hypothetical protein